MAASPEQARINGRKGGRPKGTYTRPQIRDYFSSADIRNLVELAKKKAEDGNDMMLKTLLEYVFGKPAQALEMSGKDGQPIVFMPMELLEKNNLDGADTRTEEHRD